jgi:hypothetical protein
VIDRHGATTEDWQHFAITLGLMADLLPVVSNPHATISSRSTMTAIGKTPSRYDSKRQVTGISKWTQHVARPGHIERWSREPDYGICLQTHVVRAIDVDIPDAALAAAVEELVVQQLGGRRLPRRERANSAKFLLAFRCAGELRKRVIELPSGDRIEFLAGGQQFVAAGMHPSGARYEWRGGLPDEIPTLLLDEFEAVWSALHEAFGCEERVADSPAPSGPAGQHALTLDDLREMLRFVVGSKERGHWLKVLWALRSAWRESLARQLDESAVLALADEYSRRSDTGNYSGIDDVRARFTQGDARPERGVSWRTLLWLAHQGGWRPTIQQEERMRMLATADDFINHTEQAVRRLYGIK